MELALRYSRLSRRICALFMDSLVLSLSLILLSFIASNIESQTLQVVFVATVLLSLEPLFITFTGSSLGQHLYGLRVRRTNEDKKLGVLRSYVRFFTKMPLGLLSLVAVQTTRKHQAIHDIVSDSIVIFKQQKQVMPYEVLSERDQQTDLYQYPPVARRILVMLGYWIVLAGIVGALSFVGLSESCIEYNRCSKSESGVNFILSIMLWVGIFVIASRVWQGHFYGARRTRRNL